VNQAARPSPAPPAGAARAADPLRWAGLVLGVGAAMLRAITNFSPLPYWELDPLVFPASLSGLGPGGSLLVDSLIMLGAGLILAGQFAARQSVRLVPSALVLLGAAGVLLHGRTGLGNQWNGSSWSAAMLLGLAAGELGREERFRRVVVACLAAFVAVLAVKGAQQVFLEHAGTVRQFNENREAFLAAQGWTTDSAMARAYERRLVQNEASGWFGLANVYASFAAAGSVMLAGISAGAIRRVLGARERDERVPLGPVIVAAAALALAVAALFMAGARGGFVAAFLGAAAAVALVVAGRQRHGSPSVLGGIISLGAMAATFALVIVRGQFGERLHELSLLFRWHYMQAATRIALGHPLTGVGPDGFQPAYLLAKNPLNPEEVSSPHNVLLEWWATLGLFGLAWCAALLWWVWSAGARGAAPHDTDAQRASANESPARAEIRCVIGIGALATLAASWLEQGELTADTALVRLVGLGVWSVVGWGVLTATRRPSALGRLGLAAAAIAIASHALIDVTGTWLGSAAAFALFLGTAAAGDGPGRPARRLHIVPAAAALLLAAWTSLAWSRPALEWESTLAAAAAPLRPIAEISQVWRAVATDRSLTSQERRAGAERVAAELSKLLSRRVDPTDESINRALTDAELGATPAAIHLLQHAAAAFPDQWKLDREASRLALRHAAALLSLNERDAAMLDLNLAAVLARPTDPARAASTAYGWLALVYQTQADLLADAGRLSRAAEALEEAARRDPFGIEFPRRLMRVYASMNDPEHARFWAGKALELDKLGRLDPLTRTLSDVDRREAQRLAGQAPEPPS
jgi:tetratricopeptide (TPR) repeat protein